jgi:hypothetical protein
VSGRGSTTIGFVQNEALAGWRSNPIGAPNCPLRCNRPHSLHRGLRSLQHGSITRFIVTAEKLKVALLDGQQNVACVILTEEPGKNGESNVIGMVALYYHRFSSFRGQPSMWLEDLFIVPTSRSNGAGMKLMQRLLIVEKDSCIALVV